jgi:hypothetical protein
MHTWGSWDLHHQDRHQLLLRIDPKSSAPEALPKEFSGVSRPLIPPAPGYPQLCMLWKSARLSLICGNQSVVLTHGWAGALRRTRHFRDGSMLLKK